MAIASAVHCTDFLWISDRSEPDDPASKRYAVSYVRHVDEALFWRSLDSAASAADVFAPTAIKGHFALVSTSGRKARILTDCGGSIAVYYGSRNGRTVVGTNISEVGIALGAEPDCASVYDFVANGAICHPYTWFSGVRVCDPGSLTIIECDAHARSTAYWRPSEERWLRAKEGAVLLRETMARSVMEAVSSGPVSMMFSGGEDSRVLAALIRSIERHPFIFLRAKNREYDLARSAAALLGMRLSLLPMPADHYVRDLTEKQSRVGLGIDLAHAHCYGFHELMGGERTTVGGWGSDTFLKGHYLAQYNGRPSFGQTTTNWNVETPSPEVAERRSRRLAELLAFLPRTAYDWDRYWPLSAHEHYGHFAASRRLLPMVEPYLFSEVVQISALLDPQRKIDFSTMRHAFGSQLGLAGFVPRSGGRIPRLSSKRNRALSGLVMRALQLHEKFLRPNVDQEPWIVPEEPVPLATLAAALRDWDEGKLSAWAVKVPLRELRLLQVCTALAETAWERIEPTAPHAPSTRLTQRAASA